MRFDRRRFDDVVDLKITRAKKCGNDCNITAAHTVTQKHSSSSCDCHKKTRAPSVGALLPLLLYCCRTADAAPLLSLQRVPWLRGCFLVKRGLYRPDAQLPTTYQYAPFFPIPSHLLSSPFLSCSLLVVTQIRGHLAGSFPPSPLGYVPLRFYREKDSFQHFLPSSTRVELIVPTYPHA